MKGQNVINVQITEDNIEKIETEIGKPIFRILGKIRRAYGNPTYAVSACGEYFLTEGEFDIVDETFVVNHSQPCAARMKPGVSVDRRPVSDFITWARGAVSISPHIFRDVKIRDNLSFTHIRWQIEDMVQMLDDRRRWAELLVHLAFNIAYASLLGDRIEDNVNFDAAIEALRNSIDNVERLLNACIINLERLYEPDIGPWFDTEQDIMECVDFMNTYGCLQQYSLYPPITLTNISMPFKND